MEQLYKSCYLIILFFLPLSVCAQIKEKIWTEYAIDHAFQTKGTTEKEQPIKAAYFKLDIKALKP